MLVLGIDGADPILIERFMDEGKLPHFSQLRRQGGYLRLGSSNPPQSPVAWATFTTGLDPGGHGIFDFIHRDPQTMLPVPSLTRLDQHGKAVLLRQGKPFWGYLVDRGIPATVLKVAANYPPTGLPGKVLSEMGTPDLSGSYGTFTYYTEAQERPPTDLSGGRFVPVAERDGVLRASLIGAGQDTLPLAVSRDAGSALISAGGKRLVLRVGEWSEWVRLPFEHGEGIVRFFLKSARPLELYASPVNIDPESPVVPISSPDGLARHLGKCCGPFYTQGMPEDTKALVHGVLDDDQFLAQSGLVTEERRRLMAQGLTEFDEGLFFFYLSSTDMISHLFWNATDPRHPGYSKARAEAHGDAILKAYQEADEFVGQAMQASDERTTLLVMSDHGFAPFYRSFDLNAWLLQKGYFKPGSWGQTRAYGMGFNGLYLNLKGREREGTVTSSERDQLLRQLREELLEVVDPRDGEKVFHHIYLASEIYHGPYLERSPELILGYNRGFRCSWQSALGEAGSKVLEDNLDPWSGDHLMDPEVVPGVLFCNKPLTSGEADLKDVGPTVMARFGIAPAPNMLGHDLLK